MTLRNATADDIAWAAGRIGIGAFRSDARGIARVNRDGSLAAVVVFDTFSSCDCNMHIASDGTRRWLTRDLLMEAFAYPFIQLGLRRVTLVVTSKNAAALEFGRKLGFEVEGVCREAMPDDDVVILGLLRRNCLLIPPDRRL